MLCPENGGTEACAGLPATVTPASLARRRRRKCRCLWAGMTNSKSFVATAPPIFDKQGLLEAGCFPKADTGVEGGFASQLE